MLKAVEAKFGSMPIAALNSPRVRGKFIDWQEDIGRDRPREADNRLTVLSAALGYALDKGQIVRNPLAGFTRLYSSDRAEIVWTEADMSMFMRDAPVELQRALILAIHTGQRYGDLIRLRWSDYDGERINLVQSKTKARVSVRCTPALKAMLDETPKTCPFILARADGSPWHTEKDDKRLGKEWRAHMRLAGMYPKPWEAMSAEERRDALHFHDLRGTAITLLKIAGAEIPQICAITGHSLASATQILEKYMARNSALADAGIHRLETARETAFANRLQTTPRRAIIAPNIIPKEQGDAWYRRPGSNGGPPDPQSGALTC
jgi:integrase